MLISTSKLVEVFCHIDDFCIAFEQFLTTRGIGASPSPHALNKPAISLSEMMCLEVLYHRSGHKCFEYFYSDEVIDGPLRSYFPKAPSYTRFVELKPRMLTALICYLQCRLHRSADGHLLCRLHHAHRVPPPTDHVS